MRQSTSDFLDFRSTEKVNSDLRRQQAEKDFLLALPPFYDWKLDQTEKKVVFRRYNKKAIVESLNVGWSPPVELVSNDQYYLQDGLVCAVNAPRCTWEQLKKLEEEKPVERD